MNNFNTLVTLKLIVTICRYYSCTVLYNTVFKFFCQLYTVVIHYTQFYPSNRHNEKYN